MDGATRPLRLAVHRPATRASHLREDLEALASLGQALEAAVRARLRPETLELIAGATRIDWLPIALNVEMAEAVHAIAGPEGARRWARASFALSLRGVFRRLAEWVTALFDPTPDVIYRHATRAWTTVYRSCGRLSTERLGAESVRLHASDFPRELLGPAFLDALCGTFESAFDFCQYEGTVVRESTDARRGTATFVASWARRAASGR